jgi:YVTN family beta-propeller protein
VKTAKGPVGVTVHPDGKRVFVSAAGAGKVQVLDTSANRIVADFEVGNGPSSMAFTPDGHKLYVTCGRRTRCRSSMRRRTSVSRRFR